MTEIIHFQRHHFTSGLSTEEARELFRTSVRYVEIETFTYCNRHCWFCPNAKIPERQDKAGNRYMDRSLYARIIDELASVNFGDPLNCPGPQKIQGQIQFGRYNEPLSERNMFLAIVGYARAALPNAWLYSHTNGDFLTREYLDELRNEGLNGLAVQTYLGNDEKYDEFAILARQSRKIQSLGLTAKTVADRTAPGLRSFKRAEYRGMEITFDARNFAEIGTDRGGLVEIQREKPRIAPCFVPFSSLYIDWNGNTVPCCNIRSDVPEHANLVVCRLQDGHSIFEAFAALWQWRRSLLRWGAKSGPCATCRYDELDAPAGSEAELERIYQIAVSREIGDGRSKPGLRDVPDPEPVNP